MQLPARVFGDLLDVARLIDSVKDNREFRRQVRTQSTPAACFIKAFQSLMPKAPDAHSFMYGMSEQKSSCLGRVIPQTTIGTMLATSSSAMARLKMRACCGSRSSRLKPTPKPAQVDVDSTVAAISTANMTGKSLRS